jgi:DNA-binding Lrp family transcriptional regulator
MDRTDLILCQLLLLNSRRSYRELADTLNLSVTAVHKRIQSLVELGVIRSFTAKIGIEDLNAIPVIIFGTSNVTQIQNLKTQLAEQGSIYWLATAGGNFLYIGAYLKSIAELEPLVNFCKETAEMLEPNVGIASPSSSSIELKTYRAQDTTLYDLDYEIIRSLRDNSRKATSEIAEELHVSAKTVRRRLSRMINLKLVELSIEWYPDASNDIITIFHCQLKPEADRSAMDKILKKYSPNMIFYWSFTNMPGSSIAFVWTNTMKELQGIRERLEHEEALRSVSPNILYAGYIFKTWRDQLPEK